MNMAAVDSYRERFDKNSEGAGWELRLHFVTSG